MSDQVVFYYVFIIPALRFFFQTVGCVFIFLSLSTCSLII